MTDASRRWSVTRLSGSLGARVEGVDLSRPLDEGAFEQMGALLLAHHVLVFGGQSLTPAEHVAFARRWGPISVHPGLTPIDGHPEVVEVFDPGNPVASTWHQDQTFLARPPLLSILVARVLPAAGGDTMFSNQHLAFERLSPALQDVLAGLRARHSRVVVRPDGSTVSFGEAVHPVAPRHPLTGRRALFVNADYTTSIDGMTEEESIPLLHYLYGHACRPELTCRHQWSAGDVVLWDNRSLLHCVVSDVEGDRLLHKVTVGGDAPD
jgi:taurine dioxygenase